MSRHQTSPHAAKPPDHLDDIGRAKFSEVLKILADRGDVIDAGALDATACYANGWSEWIAAETQVKALGMVVKSPAGFAQENPWLTIARKAQTEVRRWGDVLHLTPKAKGTARANPARPAPPPDRQRHNPLEKLRIA